ncbi:type I restriction-modification system methyltransferase subunit [Clostridium botulinum CFSAN002367]|nr:type I restriction-modification system methyltransferase subunit [Clostridium botulinum CFSAN002367]
MITMQSWMFLGSYEKMREYLIDNYSIKSLVHLGSRAFDEIGGEVVQTTTFVIKNNSIEKNGVYIGLSKVNTSSKKK